MNVLIVGAGVIGTVYGAHLGTAGHELMCLAITQGFQELHDGDVRGCPRNLALLHNRWLDPVAIRYWARVMRSPMGETAFAAHARHGEPEMRRLADDVIARLTRKDASDALHTLLAPRP